MVPLGPFVLTNTEDQDVEVESNLGRILGSLEPPEMLDGTFELWDSQGRHADLGVSRFDVIVESWSEPNENELRHRLLLFLSSAKPNVDFSQQSTLELINTAYQFQESKRPSRRLKNWLTSRLGK